MKTLLTLLLSCLSVVAQTTYSDDLLMTRSSTLLQGLQGYWRLEEASGTRYDRSKNGNHLTAVNSPGQAAGVSSATGNCATFASSSSQYLSITSNSSVSAGDIDFTIAGWFNATSFGAFRGMVSKWDTSNDAYILYYDSTAARFKFAVSSNGTSVTGIVTNNVLGSPSSGSWYFIVAWHDSVNNTLGIQSNNGTADTVSYSGGVTTANAPFCIGVHDISGAPQYWNGSIDEVGFWKRILTTAEKTRLYRSGGGVTHPQFHARALRDWRRWEPEFPTLAAWLNRKQEVIDL